MNNPRIRYFFSLILIIFAACATAPIEEAKPVAAAAPKVEAVVNKKPPLEEAMERAAVLSQNGGAPIIYPGGALITFGETFLGRRMADELSVEFIGGVSNSLLKMEKKDGVARYEYLTDEKGQARQFLALKSTEPSDRYQISPASGVLCNGKYYIFYEIVDKEAPKTTKGASRIGLARSGASWQQWDRLALKGSFPISAPPQSVVCGKDGNLYAYFLEKRGESSVVRVARVAQDKIESPAAYTVLQPVLATDVFGQVSVAWNEYLQSYVMCHVGHNRKDPRAIYIRRSQSPFGPFSQPEQILRLSNQPVGEDLYGLVYCSYLYPELFRDNGRVMTLSYCVREKHAKPYFYEFEVKK